MEQQQQTKYNEAGFYSVLIGIWEDMSLIDIWTKCFGFFFYFRNFFLEILKILSTSIQTIFVEICDCCKYQKKKMFWNINGAQAGNGAHFIWINNETNKDFVWFSKAKLICIPYLFHTHTKKKRIRWRHTQFQYLNCMKTTGKMHRTKIFDNSIEIKTNLKHQCIL